MRRREALRAGLGLGAGVLGVGAAAGHGSDGSSTARTTTEPTTDRTATAGSTTARTASAGTYEPLGSVEIEGAKEAVVGDDGRTAFVAATTGYATVDVSDPSSPRVLAERRDLLADREGGPLRGIHDVKVSGDRLLAVGPAHERNAVAGALLVDVSDPAAPERLAFFETTYPIHNAFLADGFAYLTGNDGGRNPLVIVDLRDGDPAEVGRWALADVDSGWEAVPPHVRPVHDVWVQDGRAHLPLWDAGTWIVDVSDPSAPSALGSIGGRSPEALASDDLEGQPVTTPPGNHHYAAVDESGALLGINRESWAVETGDGGLRGGPGGIELWDASDLDAPELLSTIAPPATNDPTYDGTWTTSHNFEFRDGVLYSSWYQGGVKRHDVSDPRDPRELTWWRDPGAASFWTARTARSGAGGGFFVGGSMGDAHGSLENVPGRLYTFPDRDGIGGENGRLPGGTATPGSPASGSSASTRSPAAASPRTSAAASDRTATAARSGTAPGADGSNPSTAARAPGFGPGGAAASLGAVAWLLRRRGRGDDRRYEDD